MKTFRYIFAALTCALFLLSCSGDEGKVIPRDKLAEIYAEMFVTDQWITSVPGVRHSADTSLVYEPILERYGYTSADYRRSVDVYMNDPERFSRILRTTGEILDKRLIALNKRKEELDHIKALEKLLHQLRYESDFRAEEFFPYLFDEPYVHYYDSLDVRPDSVLMVYRFSNIERADTVYVGLEMIIRDSLAVKDTVAGVDSVAVSDSINVAKQPLRKPDIKSVGNMNETKIWE